MQRIVSAAICGLLFSGCASQQYTPEMQAEFERTIPVCTEGKDCERQWAAARRWVLDNAGKKIQHYSDDFIETYGSVNQEVALAVQVTKDPVDGNRYKIIMKCGCSNPIRCAIPVGRAKLDFNRKVSAAALKM